MKIMNRRLNTSTIVVTTVLVLAGGLFMLEVTHTTHIFRRQATTVTNKTPTIGGGSSNNQKGEPSLAQNSTTTADNTSEPGDNKSNTGGATPTAILTPSGDFVSAHGGQDYPISPNSTLASVCNTTPGASCKITFTKDGVTKSLDPQNTDRSGSTYWNNWTPASIGLTAGSWQVKAIATLNGQTKTATDGMQLVVSS